MLERISQKQLTISGIFVYMAILEDENWLPDMEKTTIELSDK